MKAWVYCSYSPSIVTITIFYCLRDITSYWFKIANFFNHTCILRPPAWGDLRRNFVKMLMFIKLERLGYRMVKKNYHYMLSRFHLIPERHGQTDRHANLISVTRCNISSGAQGFNSAAPAIWNSLLPNVCS